jgi:hypothetical protein
MCNRSTATTVQLHWTLPDPSASAEEAEAAEYAALFYARVCQFGGTTCKVLHDSSWSAVLLRSAMRAFTPLIAHIPDATARELVGSVWKAFGIDSPPCRVLRVYGNGHALLQPIGCPRFHTCDATFFVLPADSAAPDCAQIVDCAEHVDLDTCTDGSTQQVAFVFDNDAAASAVAACFSEQRDCIHNGGCGILVSVSKQ